MPEKACTNLYTLLPLFREAEFIGAVCGNPFFSKLFRKTGGTEHRGRIEKNPVFLLKKSFHILLKKTGLFSIRWNFLTAYAFFCKFPGIRYID